MKRTAPYTAAQIVSALLYHYRTRDMYDSEVTFQVQLDQSYLFDETM